MNYLLFLNENLLKVETFFANHSILVAFIMSESLIMITVIILLTFF